MEASLVVPGPLDVAGTLSRFHLWGEDPANRFADGVQPELRLHGAGAVDAPSRLPNDEVIERVTAVRGFRRWTDLLAGHPLEARTVAGGGA